VDPLNPDPVQTLARQILSNLLNNTENRTQMYVAELDKKSQLAAVIVENIQPYPGTQAQERSENPQTPSPVKVRLLEGPLQECPVKR
jgi:hypothetical protein